MPQQIYVRETLSFNVTTISGPNGVVFTTETGSKYTTSRVRGPLLRCTTGQGKKECNPRQGYEGKQSVRYTMNTIINVTKRDEEYGNKATTRYCTGWNKQNKKKDATNRSECERHREDDLGSSNDCLTII